MYNIQTSTWFGLNFFLSSAERENRANRLTVEVEKEYLIIVVTSCMMMTIMMISTTPMIFSFLSSHRLLCSFHIYMLCTLVWWYWQIIGLEEVGDDFKRQWELVPPLRINPIPTTSWHTQLRKNVMNFRLNRNKFIDQRLDGLFTWSCQMSDTLSLNARTHIRLSDKRFNQFFLLHSFRIMSTSL